MIKIEPQILSNHDITTFLQQAKTIHFNKGDALVIPGERCKYLYLVESGILRSYYYDTKGNNITHWFASEHMLITIPPSFFNSEDNVFGIEALEDTKVSVFTYDNLEYMFEKSRYIERLFRIIVTQIMVTLGKKVIDLQTKTALTRYNELLLNFPEIFNRAALGHIASYLGITQQSLSRIRAQIKI